MKYEILSYLVGLTSGIAVIMLLDLIKLFKEK